MTRNECKALTDLTDKAEFLYLRAGVACFGLAYVRGTGGGIDLTVPHTADGLKEILRELGVCAREGCINWHEAAVLTAWVRSSFWTIRDGTLAS